MVLVTFVLLSVCVFVSFCNVPISCYLSVYCGVSVLIIVLFTTFFFHHSERFSKDKRFRSSIRCGKHTDIQTLTHNFGQKENIDIIKVFYFASH